MLPPLLLFTGVRDMENNYCIYKHTAPNGKVYIGQTCQKPESRFGKDGYRYKGCTLFYNAIQKYGFDNFKHEILFDKLTQEEANEKEIELIREHRSNERAFGYNLQDGGCNGSPTEETRKKMSEWQIGKVFSDETKQRISMARFGQKDSDETRKKKSDSHKGKRLSDETKIKLSVAGTKRVTNEQIDRVRELGLSNKGKKHTEKSRKNMSESHKGKNCKKVLCVETKIVYNSLTEASECTSIKRQNIGKVCNGRLKTAGGYHWDFV